MIEQAVVCDIAESAAFEERTSPSRECDGPPSRWWRQVRNKNTGQPVEMPPLYRCNRHARWLDPDVTEQGPIGTEPMDLG